MNVYVVVEKSNYFYSSSLIEWHNYATLNVFFSYKMFLNCIESEFVLKNSDFLISETKDDRTLYAHFV
jgi:hypothetical protein